MISIIIPLYNVEDYIISCLESLEAQTYKNYELIIVNDGSTDNSYLLVQEYVKRTNMNVLLLSQKNAGVSSARNKGLEYAKGEYVCFIDADDIVDNKYLEIMLTLCCKASCDLIICGLRSVPEEFRENENKIIANTDKTLIMDTQEALKSFLYKKINCGMGSFLVRKEILSDNNVNFSVGFRYSEDQELIWKMINHSKRIAYNEVELYFYRMRKNSAMSIIDSKRTDGLKLMERLEVYFRDYNPVFYEEFRKFGIARWVWATTWQAALGSDDFKNFKFYIDRLNASIYFKKLLLFPDKKVKLSSLLYIISPKIYYYSVKFILPKVFDVRSAVLSKT
ncbi:glycosyltransferase [Sporosarcina luteola]|uniref:glycosyltransferase family 2 protein n=1 Tax=Sporosarcina luteola TaxID=582850 RepID=UPI002040289F|nr:glycosyltransferase [Sporosarcina luteola]MCM3636543.1 glycosyltransferase [Sporosarcina luteola]